MKTKNLRVLFLVVAALMISTACSAPQPAPATSASQSAAATVEATSAAPVEPSAPAVENKPTIKWLGLYFENHTPDKNSYLEKTVTELTGYNVEYYMLPQENASEKLMLDLSSGVDYDIIRLGRNDFSKLVDENAVLALDDLIKNYAPSVFEIRKPDDPSWAAVKSDGKIYAMPFINNPEVIQHSIIYRADILKKLNLNPPTTADEFYNVCKTIRDQTGMIPLTGNKPWYQNLMPIIGSAFSISTWEEIDGQFTPNFLNPRMKEYLAFLNKLYKDGLLDQEYPVNKRSTAIEKFSGGKAAMFQYHWWEYSIHDATKQNVPEAEIAYLAPLKDENGKQEMESVLEVTRFVVVPKVSKHPEDVMRFVDKLTSEDAQKRIALGVEGTHYKVENDMFVPISPAFEKDIGKSFWYFPIDNLAIYPKMETEAHYAGTAHLMESFTNCTTNNMSIAIRNPFGLLPPFKSQAEYGGTIDSALIDNFMKIVAGAEPVDKYDEFISQWKQDGGDKILAEVNEWYKSSK